ncbi:polysaccharide lyase family 7 protein [Fretibacter rubidus]|uniref:polysaccharide lyase family 7 protein n=1 Tax=Fretibacter rubidus TaxID=570162 RepID=UPI00352A9F5F
MRRRLSSLILGAGLSLGLSSLAIAQTALMADGGFEAGIGAWAEHDPNGKDVSISGDAFLGEKSVKILSKDGNIQQAIQLAPNQPYTLSAHIKGSGVIGVKVGKEIFFDANMKAKKWSPVSVTFESDDTGLVYVFASGRNKGARFDDFDVSPVDGEAETSTRFISRESGGYGLSPDFTPGQNFDLLGWTLSVPVDENKDGKADNIKERDLAGGFTMKPWFYTGDDGGMVMRAPNKGPTTSKNTKNVRSELRGMLRRGDSSISTRNNDGTPNKNNWVFSSAPQKAKDKAGAVDGTLTATLKIDRTTESGKKIHHGVIVIGQIHAKHDEPVKLFYRKRAGHKNGVIFASHEPSGGDDIYYDLIGERKNYKDDPMNGIPLDEVFSYEIKARGNFIDVRIIQDGAIIAAHTIDQTGSGYDAADEFMYFKAGVYNQNNTGRADDYAQATFYEVKASFD